MAKRITFQQRWDMLTACKTPRAVRRLLARYKVTGDRHGGRSCPIHNFLARAEDAPRIYVGRLQVLAGVDCFGTPLFAHTPATSGFIQEYDSGGLVL